ncbi:cartilage matrix protein-like [Lingula anatina]|uniref:Cartilage matrix protein-like n=1 Tax=Lingula anatina TaxID=7574 RepID=A0A1S3JZ48_LINAN|nr:cartilage matrix protein-like [Lingula anatina]XP_013415674.1 cartilage matrix protein-like [Lingula anatina]|eukprot:XP_013415668.1 cartilage matrix protein-like [Lingula anatina]
MLVLSLFLIQVYMASLQGVQAAITCNRAIDLVFVLDVTTPLTPIEFLREKQFIKNIINNFAVDSNYGAKVGLVLSGGSYDSKAVFYLDTFEDRENMMLAIDFAVHQDKGRITWSHVALRQARKDLFTVDRGSRLGENPLVVIFITGNTPAWPLGATLEGSFLEQSGITTYAIGIGKKITKTELNAVSIDPKRSLVVNSVYELAGVDRALASLICRQRTRDPTTIQKCENDPKADIAFALGSRAIREDGLAPKVTRLVNNLARRVKVGPDGILMSMLPEFCFAPGFKFMDYETKDEVLGHFDRIENTLPSTADLIRTMVSTTFTPEHGSRPDARHLGVVLVDSELQEPDDAERAAMEARKAGIEIFVVGVGRNITYAELERIASTPPRQHVTMVDNYCTVPSVHFKLFDLLC